MDTMPDEAMLDQIRGAALQVPGALGIEKCRARKTGMKYHVDPHLEVDPNLTVQVSHDIATQVRIVIKESLELGGRRSGSRGTVWAGCGPDRAAAAMKKSPALPPGLTRSFETLLGLGQFVGWTSDPNVNGGQQEDAHHQRGA